MSAELDVALGLLDHQVVDADGRRCGKVDDLELDGLREDRPRVSAIVVGRRRAVRVPWEKVDRLEAAVHLKVTASELGLASVEGRVRRFVEWIPGA